MIIRGCDSLKLIWGPYYGLKCIARYVYYARVHMVCVCMHSYIHARVFIYASSAHLCVRVRACACACGYVCVCASARACVRVGARLHVYNSTMRVCAGLCKLAYLPVEHRHEYYYVVDSWKKPHLPGDLPLVLYSQCTDRGSLHGRLAQYNCIISRFIAELASGFIGGNIDLRLLLPHCGL